MRRRAIKRRQRMTTPRRTVQQLRRMQALRARRLARLRRRLLRALGRDSVKPLLACTVAWASLAAGVATTGCGVEGRNPEDQPHTVFREFRHRNDKKPARQMEIGEASPDFRWPEGDHPKRRIEVAGYGAFEIELYRALAPQTVDNFIELADTGFYAGTSFHRVIPGFVVQGGDPNTKDGDPRNDGHGGPGYPLEDEFDGGAPMERGIVAMANRGKPNTGGSQFFVLVDDKPELFGRYAVFGRVTAGMDVIDRINGVRTDEVGRWGPKDRPLEPIVVVAVTDPAVAPQPGDLASRDAAR